MVELLHLLELLDLMQMRLVLVLLLGELDVLLSVHHFRHVDDLIRGLPELDGGQRFPRPDHSLLLDRLLFWLVLQL